MVTVDTYGEVTERRRGQSQLLADTLGEGLILEMALIPGGAFQMGSPKTEAERNGNEGPQHSVLVSPFFLGKFEVTQAQWLAVAALPQVNRPLVSDPSRFKGADRPVENVTWYEAIEFCQRLSAKIGRVFRLPSEAEWEFACRAGAATPYHFGQTVRADLENYNGNKPYGKAPPGKNREQTTPVGSFHAANPYGLYDVHGNVAEWCTDPYHKNYRSAPHDGKPWDVGGDDRYRIVRGGAWNSKAKDSRSARRNGFVPGSRYDFVGFRVAVSLSQGGK
ncbi:MAG: formylglycine-generating enzyme family protein [Armatimonadetes bacterium]|nr:formylglycine-generating enzyme family protein [Armatimonadota bacterium]